MKYAADFRQEARAALQGKWPLAILVGLVAAILGGATSGGPEFKINFTGGSLNANIQYAGQTIYSWGDGITPGLRAVLVGGAIYLILAAIVLGVLYFILGSVIKVGYARFNLNLTAGEKPPFETLFSYFPHWKTVAVAWLLQSVYVLLWMLLLVIPGIVAGYSYAMTDYILAEHPELTASEAIVDTWKDALCNDFEESVFGIYPKLKDIKNRLYTLGASYAQMSGSGSSLFGIFKNNMDEQSIKDEFADCRTFVMQL